MSDRSSSTDSAQPEQSRNGPAQTAQSTPHSFGSAEQPPGLREQFKRTREAAFGLVSAHVKLARAELSEIADEVKRVALLAGMALATAMLAGLMATIGTILWFDEWVFGSIGWGALHGTELFLALAIMAILAVLELGLNRAIGTFILALLVGAAVAVIFGIDWRQVSDQNLSGVGSGIRPFVLAVPIGAVVLGVIGLIVGAIAGSGARAGVGLVVGAILGAILGAIATVGTGVAVAIAVGIALALPLWPIFSAVAVFRGGLDMERLKDRFYPDETIRTTKETIEWVRAQTPLGPKS